MGRGITGTEFAMALSIIPMAEKPHKAACIAPGTPPDFTARSVPGLWCRIVARYTNQRALEVENAYHRHPRRDGCRDPYHRLRNRGTRSRRRPRRTHDLDEPGTDVREGGGGASRGCGYVPGGVPDRTRGAAGVGRRTGPDPLSGSK